MPRTRAGKQAGFVYDVITGGNHCVIVFRKKVSFPCSPPAL
ncbi:MAG TPA: hypothetical protein VHM64_09420 [Candidatus Binatia bacterium]|nr:hypothetical protein [Candidatus Binatia bacterium]